MGKVEIYAGGLVHCSVCVPKTMKRSEIEDTVNRQNPTGIDKQWKIDGIKKFGDGSPNPNICDKDKSRKHYLMVC